MTTDALDTIKDAVSTYYGQTIQKTEDLNYDACCVADYDNSLLERLTPEVLDKRYGCGSPLPELLEGRTVLDLGSGAGIDCFIASQLVGPSGEVIGIDMTDEQLEIANRNIAPHMKNFGYDTPNVSFKKGLIEQIPVEDNSVDVVISNCVINLSTDKETVFKEILRVLKPGGEFFISDIVADRRIPQHLQNDTELWSECLTGAAYIEDLRRMTTDAGFKDVRTVSTRRLADVVEGIRFFSRNMRGFKIQLEDRCEDYGQVAVYKGTIVGNHKSFLLDDHHEFFAGVPMRVCKNTADMLSQSRFGEHFEVSEALSHFGLFDCEPEGAKSSFDNLPLAASCC